MTDPVTGADSSTTTAEPLALRLNDQLGPLPEPAQISYVTDSVMRSHEVRSYTAGQMRAYAAEQVAAERERCAAVCDGIARQYKDDSHGHAAERAANAIRLKPWRT